jgi:serine protease AprX
LNTSVQTPRTTRWGFTTAAAVITLCTVQVTGLGVSAIASSGQTPARSTGSSNFSGGKWGDPTADSLSKDAYGKNQAERDPGSLFTVEKAIGARPVWGKKDKSGRQVTGQGVAVALLDSGVNQVAGLDGAGKISYGPDLSIEASGPLAQEDTYGHGTFIAGIIAGRGANNPSSDLPSAPANVQLGIAPDAKVLAMKLATTDGSTDVSQVIAALDWVTEHPVLADGTRVRVINLSYGTDSAQPYQSDPLAAAAENAWRHGIVVVTSAGNTGSTTGRLTDPAVDPYVLAVGATDSSDRTDGWTRDRTKVAAFSNIGTTARHVDVVAPGTSLVSTRNRGSYVDTNNTSGLVSGDTSGNLFRGSGTSQAAAVVSGSVALLLQAYPTLTPDQVKYALTSTADAVTNAPVVAAGAGTINLTRALDTASHLVGTDNTAAMLRAAAIQSYASSTGQGSIDAARGGSVVVDADGNDLNGEVDAQGNAWDAAAWWQASSTLMAWTGGQWLGATWTGDTWQPGDLSSARWSSARWSSARWSDADWDSARWSSARWSSARWSSARWSSARWSSADW